ncbi:DUF4230 domain-containing protein [Sutcliffiella horikoshii]|uniref:DUF4230 domain-containing protein n=1 Tax=Sutcliffiella horikoshii TaxID=79883 RepID=A0A5D4T2Z3_9BACI|nr:DUF4230 domain-containing protein [Sutcliffiella horikoshii]TYS69755.1 DUF4230 domain-containing protein [Sutcliffiella horikoshii]
MMLNRESMEEKDEKIAHLERLLNELQGAQQQSAATTALTRSAGHIPQHRGIFKSFLKTSMLKIILTMFILLVLIGGVILVFIGDTFKQESVTYVESVQELSTLATVKAHMKVVLQEEDNKVFGKNISTNLFGTKREILVVVPSTVIAGVDLKGVTSKDMIINEETREIDITLPHAKLIQDPALQMDKIVTFVDGGIFRDDVDWEEGFDLASLAQEQTRQEAISEGLLITAEENAEIVLKEFFKNINYTVNVKFD